MPVPADDLPDNLKVPASDLPDHLAAPSSRKASSEAYEGWDVPGRDPTLATPAQIQKDKELQARSDATLKAIEPSEPGLAHLLMEPIVGIVRAGQSALGERPLPHGVEALSEASMAAIPPEFARATGAAARAMGGVVPKVPGVADRPTPQGAMPYADAAKIAKTLGVQKRATEAIERRFKAVGPTTAQEAIDKLNEAKAAGDPLTLPDVLTPAEKLAGRMYRASGESSEVIGEALRGRNAGATDRLTANINRDVGADSAYQMFDELKTARSQAAKPLFEKAYQGGSQAPLESQFEKAFSDAGAEEAAAQRDLNHALSVKQTAASARSSQAGDNVYANAGVNIDIQAADAAENEARARLQAAQATKEQTRERLQQAQADRTANAPGAVWSPRLQQFMDDPEIQQGIRQGLWTERKEAIAENRPFNASDYAIVGEDTEGNPIIGKVPTMRLLASAKEGIDAMLQSEKYRNQLTGELTKPGVALNKFQREFLKELDDLNPDYKKAREQWSGDTAAMQALRDGQNALKNKPEINARMAAEMTESERESAKLGLAQTLREVARDKGPLAGEFKTIAGTQYGADGNRARIAPFFNDTVELDRFVKSIDREATKARTANRVMGGSQSAERGAEDESILSPSEAAHGALALGAGHPLGITRAAINLGQKLWDRRDPAMNVEIARILSDTATALGRDPKGRLILNQPRTPPP